jgi:hypothetical protein
MIWSSPVAEFHPDEVSKYRCGTECQSSLCLRVGHDGILHLWEPGTVISIFVSRKFPKYYNTMVRAVQDAINDWNVTRTGPDDPRPLFRQVQAKTEATCQVKFRHSPEERNHNPKKGELLAHAFFPGLYPEIIIYSAAFAVSRINYLKNVLSHELIHVQGVRHSFAVEEDQHQGLRPSIEVGRRNDMSISNYFFLLEQLQIQDTDVEALNQLYADRHKEILGLPVMYHTAVPFLTWRGGDDSGHDEEGYCGSNAKSVVEDGGAREDDGWFLVNRRTSE